MRNLVQKFIRTGLDYRELFTMLQTQGDWEVIRTGQILSGVYRDLHSMLVSVEDMLRFLQELRQRYPKEVTDHVVSSVPADDLRTNGRRQPDVPVIEADSRVVEEA